MTIKEPKGVELATLLAWFAARRSAPTWHDVVDRFGCSRATAFRWLALHRHLAAEHALYSKESVGPAACANSSELSPAQPRRIHAGGHHGLA